MKKTQYCDWDIGCRISFPLSSQEILKSMRTSRHLLRIIDEAAIFLWVPVANRSSIISKKKEKMGWFFKESVKVTSDEKKSMIQK